MISASRILTPLLVLLGCALVLLALPTFAAATTYTVDSTGDQVDEHPGYPPCLTEANTCTLRAAIEQLNFDNSPTPNTIRFDPTIFDGSGSTATIQPSSPLPAIMVPVAIEGDGGGQCDTAAGVLGPCVGVEGSGPFLVLADGVTISGFAIGAPSTVGINLSGGDDFVARGNWFGVTLEGNPAPSGIGANVSNNSEDATFGGAAAADRNVFANADEGLVVLGADGTTIAGNYFGVGPDGTTPAANEHDLIVADEDGANTANDTTIGADVGEDGLETDACDFGCNVFASKAGINRAAIDLSGTVVSGEAPASGPTLIQGNYVGLDAAGAPMGEAATVGISVGAAASVQIGGPLSAEANHINGGFTGISAGRRTPTPAGAPGLVVEGNLVGRDLAGVTELSPPCVGVFVDSADLADQGERALVAGNSISTAEDCIVPEVGIEMVGSGGTIADNWIEDVGTGIHTKGSTKAPNLSNLIEGNVVWGAADAAIEVQKDGNGIFGNEVVGAGESGIVVVPTEPVDLFGNRVGGDSEESENVISGADNYAIELRTTEDSRNEIGRNRGTGNSNGFIVLRPFLGPENDPNGAKRPTITAAGKTAASGKALPGALVRVFFKYSDEEGELAGFLGKGTADSSGNWTVAYSAVPEQTIVTATQTNTAGGTSDLAEIAVTPVDPPAPTCATDPSLCPPDDGGGGGSASGSDSSGTGSTTSPSPPPASAAPAPKPKLTITAAPERKSSSTTATFKFKADVAGSKFQCKLDGKPFAGCKSPKTYRGLKPGKHVFKLKAIGPSGSASTVASRQFEVTG